MQGGPVRGHEQALGHFSPVGANVDLIVGEREQRR
jgi:hypothetical protein